MTDTTKTKVLVVDDSALVREAWRDLIESCDDLELMAAAPDPFVAAQKMRKAKPDVIVLDIEMPKMDGLTFLKRLMAQHPLPVVICSGLADRSRKASFRALELGALEIVPKEAITRKGEARNQAIHALRSAARSRLRRKTKLQTPVYAEPKHSADAVLPPFKPERAYRGKTAPVVAIGASTGGTEALQVVLASLERTSPGVVIVQHMPVAFTASFAARLDAMCAVEVKQACSGDRVAPGRVLLAPGDRHMLLRRGGDTYSVELRDGPPVSRHKPSVDVLFRSAAVSAGANCLGVLLTGMGSDGAQGLSELKEVGAYTVAQDEKSCVVYGMPKEAVDRGATVRVLSLERVGPFIRGYAGRDA